MAISTASAQPTVQSKASDPGQAWPLEHISQILKSRGWLADACGVATFAGALLLRWALDDALPPGFPYLTFFPAVVLTTYFCGVRPGVICAVLSGLAAWYFFIPPFNSFALTKTVAMALGLYAFVVGVDIALIHFMQITASRLRRTQMTAQELAERNELFDIALQAANAGTWSYDVVTGRVRLSAQTAQQHGLGEKEIEIDVEREWRPLAHPDDAGRTLAELQHALAVCGPYRTEFRLLQADGAVRWITAIGNVLAGERGQAVRAIGLTLDVTMRKEAELALLTANTQAEAARKEAETANAAKTDFLATMSHEVRTPLNAIIGFTDLLTGSGRLPPDLQRHVELIQASGAALLTVVNDILDFSKVEAGAIELVQQPFLPRALIDSCVSIARSLAAPKGLEVRAVVDAKLPIGLLGDQARLHQVLLNLLNNAVKFTKAGSVTLRVNHDGSSGAGERLRFTVTDTGIGIPKDKFHRLFQRFSQVDGSIARDFGGTGLGLAICKRLVELMGGEIGVVSEDGRGTTFWFAVTLPRAFGPQLVSPITGVPVAGRQGHLLLVEDAEINQELALLVLQAAGHTVDVVSTGAAAVMAVENGSYDLVLMDVQMPGMDGLTATQVIRRLKSPVARVPIIAMTANVLPDQVRAFREAGMDDHVGKPFNRAELYATISKWLPRQPIDGDDAD